MSKTSKIRSLLYTTAKVLGDVDAVSSGKVGRRVKNRVKGKNSRKTVRQSVTCSPCCPPKSENLEYFRQKNYEDWGIYVSL